MSADLLLGIDLGTTHLKAALIEAASLHVVANAQREIPLHIPQPGCAEQVPEDWWQAVIATVREVFTISGADSSSVRGIGLSGQMHGTVCIDISGESVRPAIIWADQRSIMQLERLLSQTTLAEMALHAPGWPAPGYMALTLMWLQEHEPERLQGTQYVMLPKDYVRLRLTGEIATDFSDAAATWLFDVVNRQWSDWLIGVCGIDRRLLPRVLESTEMAGRLTAEAASALGLPIGVPVAAGCADISAQALGCGVIEPGKALVVIGTGGQVLAPLGSPAVDPLMRSSLYNHAAPDRWYAQAAILSGGLGLRWLRDVLGGIDYAQLSALAGEAPPGAEGLLFIPHLVGKRPPARASSRGGFTGLSLHHGRAHLARAVMEGIAFSMRECLEAVEVRTNDPVSSLIASGGAMESPVWRQIIADVLGAPIMLMPGMHHACLGAAMLGGVSVGYYASLVEAGGLLPRASAVIEPDPTAHDLYRDAFQKYSRLAEWM